MGKIRIFLSSLSSAKPPPPSIKYNHLQTPPPSVIVEQLLDMKPKFSHPFIDRSPYWVLLDCSQKLAVLVGENFSRSRRCLKRNCQIRKFMLDFMKLELMLSLWTQMLNLVKPINSKPPTYNMSPIVTTISWVSSILGIQFK